MDGYFVDIYVGDQIQDVVSGITGLVDDIRVTIDGLTSFIDIQWGENGAYPYKQGVTYQELSAQLSDGAWIVIPTSEHRLSSSITETKVTETKVTGSLEHLEKIHYHLGEYIKSLKS